MHLKGKTSSLENSIKHQQLLFTKYVKSKNIKLNKKEIDQIFYFFEKNKRTNLSVSENIIFYKERTCFSELAKINLKKYIENFKKSKKLGNPEEKRLSSYLGNKYDGFKNLDAINKLLETGEGYIPDAFERDYFGKITLIWGQEHMGGLSHI